MWVGQLLHYSYFSNLNSQFSAAYKHGDGKKVDGKRILVDVERGRTVKGWLPRRLGKSFTLVVISMKYEYNVFLIRWRFGWDTQGWSRR